MQYIHASKNWPLFTWNSERLAPLLIEISFKQGLLAGRTLDADKVSVREAEREILLCDTIASCAIDEVKLPRSSRIESGACGDFSILFDAVSNKKKLLTAARLAEWAKLAAPSVAGERDASEDNRSAAPAMPVERLASEVRAFLAWFNYNRLPAPGSDEPESAPTLWSEPLLRAGIAYLWFMALSPYGKESGRLARAICNLVLHRQGTCKTYYSLADSMLKDVEVYRHKLSEALHGGLDISEWLEWFLSRLDHAISHWEQPLAPVLRKAKLRRKALSVPMNDRQRLVFETMLERGIKRINTSTYARISDSSSDSALRDILEMIDWGLMRKNSAGGRSTNYSLKS